MTQPHSPTPEHTTLDQLSGRLEDFDQLVANVFSGYDTLHDTPWVEPAAKQAPMHGELKGWCVKQWPHLRASAMKHFAEAKRRVMS
jgi:hypothetical protein